MSHYLEYYCQRATYDSIVWYTSGAAFAFGCQNSELSEISLICYPKVCGTSKSTYFCDCILQLYVYCYATLGTRLILLVGRLCVCAHLVSSTRCVVTTLRSNCWKARMYSGARPLSFIHSTTYITCSTFLRPFDRFSVPVAVRNISVLMLVALLCQFFLSFPSKHHSTLFCLLSASCSFAPCSLPARRVSRVSFVFGTDSSRCQYFRIRVS